MIAVHWQTQLRQNFAMHKWQALIIIAGEGKQEPRNRQRTEASCSSRAPYEQIHQPLQGN
jgi:hypothetical protein